MAEYLREILKDQLFTAQTDTIERSNLPSPEELRGFVFLVAKKLPNGIVNDAEFYAVAVDDTAEEGKENEEKQANCNGRDGSCVDETGKVLQPVDKKERESDTNVRKKFKVAKALSDCVFVREVQFRGFVVTRDDGKSTAFPFQNFNR